MAVNMKDKAEATKKMVESVRDLMTVKITLPLGNPNLKLVHTNQFLFTELEEEVFNPANMEAISTALNSTYSRYSGYQKNRWYIEKNTISNNGKDAKMELEVNPFASSFNSYRDGRTNIFNTYNNIVEQENKNNKSTDNVKSVKTENTTVKGGEGAFIDDLVKKIIGNETNVLKKAKLIHSHLINHLTYSYYECTRHSTPKSCYEAKYINCADTARLTASMMRSAGIDCYVVHSTCHFYTVFKYNGELHCSDATSKSTRSTIDKYWKASSCHNGYTTTFTGKNCYYANCGKNPSC